MRVRVSIQPNAKHNQIMGWREDGVLKVKIKAPPIEGKANQALCEFLSEVLGVGKFDITVLHGHTSKNKVIEIVGLDVLPDFHSAN